MRQPKFKFGDKFRQDVKVKVNGSQISGFTFAYVTSISADSSTDGFNYNYRLSNQIPQAYYSPEWTSEVMNERALEERWTHVPDV